MRIKYDFEKPINFVVILLLSSTVILTPYSWGRYFFLGCILCIFLLNIFKHKGKFSFKLVPYFVFLSLFIVYVCVNALWAFSLEKTLIQVRTLIEIMFMVWVLYYTFYDNDNAISELLSDIKISCVIVVLYSIFYYGVDVLVMMTKLGERIDNTYANINTIAIMAAVGIIIEFDEIVSQHRIKLMSLSIIPSLFFVVVSQSRKGFIMIGMGVILTIWIRDIFSRNAFKMIVKIIFYMFVGIAILMLILNLPAFSGLMERMEGMINGFTGKGNVDSSTALRSLMIQIGWDAFKENPLGGIGIGNSGLYAMKFTGDETYLHNNFIELLATGGLVGFSIYYSMYIYLFSKYRRFKKCKNKEYDVCFVLMIILLIMDYGRVSYYTKSQYVYLMVFFLEVEFLRRNYRNLTKRGNNL